jgi:hypothetical protein
VRRDWLIARLEWKGWADMEADPLWRQASRVGAFRSGDRYRDDGGAGGLGKASYSASRLAERAGRHALPFRKDHETIAAPEDLLRNVDRVVVRGSAVHRKAPERTQEPRVPTLAEELPLGHVVDRPTDEQADDDRIENAAVVGGENQRAGLRDAFAAAPLEAKPDDEHRVDERTNAPVQQAVRATLTGTFEGGGVGRVFADEVDVASQPGHAKLISLARRPTASCMTRPR